MPRAALLVAMLGVHELRGLLAFGDVTVVHRHAPAALVLLTVVATLAVALASALERVPRCVGGGTRVARLWPAATAALLALYGGQEPLDGWLSAGHHPAGLDALTAGNGWTAAPLALAFGLLVAMTVRVARTLVRDYVGQIRAPRLLAPRCVTRAARVLRLWDRRDRLLASHLTGRAPPLVCG